MIPNSKTDTNLQITDFSFQIQQMSSSAKNALRLFSVSDPVRPVHTWFVIISINSGETGRFFWSSSVKGNGRIKCSKLLLLLLKSSQLPWKSQLRRENNRKLSVDKIDLISSSSVPTLTFSRLTLNAQYVTSSPWHENNNKWRSLMTAHLSKITQAEIMFNMLNHITPQKSSTPFFSFLR